MVVEKTFYYYDNDIDIKTTYVKYSNTGSARLIATSVITMSCTRSPDVTGMQNTSKFTKLKSIIGTTRLRNMNFECLFKVSL
jgi:hypothetical protein